MVGRNRNANFDPFVTLQLKNVSLIDDNLQIFCYLKKEVDGTGLWHSYRTFLRVGVCTVRNWIFGDGVHHVVRLLILFNCGSCSCALFSALHVRMTYFDGVQYIVLNNVQHHLDCFYGEMFYIAAHLSI